MVEEVFQVPWMDVYMPGGGPRLTIRPSPTEWWHSVNYGVEHVTYTGCLKTVNSAKVIWAKCLIK